MLSKLREVMLKPPGRPGAIHAYIIPTDDAHQSEYICARDKRREQITGFTGSAGTAVVTQDRALLWTDGRYYEQATQELDINWTLMKDGQPTTPTIEGWLVKNLAKGSQVGVDPKLLSFRNWKPIQKELFSNGCELVPIEKNLIDLIWENQPSVPDNFISPLEFCYTGKTIKEKHMEVIQEMQDKGVDAVLVTALDEVAWFMNMRGKDIDFNPVFFAYLIITHDAVTLFVNPEKLFLNYGSFLEQNEAKVVCRRYENVKDELLETIKNTTKKIWISPTASYFFTNLIPPTRRHQEITPIARMKAIKNCIETTGMIESHQRDGAALCRYLAWLEKSVAEGNYVDEMSGARKLQDFRNVERFVGLSFETISSVGPNAAVIHYKPKESTKRQITNKDIYLCDSGAQYMDGTTDVTRTVHFGQPTEFEKECYTRVLKGQLGLTATIFPKKVRGAVLDTIARKALWDVGLDYEHGTGHGIGHYLNVHEGPMGIGKRLMPDDPGLVENMFVSIEPGYYKPGEFGIRIEDIAQIIPVKAAHDFDGRGALGFKTITMCPKQTKLINKSMLNPKEIKMLNDYHNEVRETLTPILEKIGDQLAIDWLNRETKPI